MLQELAQAHDVTRAQYEKLAQARSSLDLARTHLESLMKLGDLVTPDDVIKAAGELVAGGLSPMAVAKLISDMPEQGPALAGWITQHEQGLQAREAQLAPVLEAGRHQLGVTAMRLIAAHSIAGALQQQAAPSAGSEGNALMPQGAPQTTEDGGNNAPS